MGAGLGAGRTASLEVEKGANPKEQEAALGEVQEGQWVVEEGVVAGLLVPGERVGVRSDGRQELVKVLGFGAWPLMWMEVEEL